MKILAIESSCDETAAAVVEDGRYVLSNAVYTQIDIHKIYGGVVPEIASRKHTEKITAVVQSALEQAQITEKDLDAIAVTYAPGLIGALLTGVGFAKAYAYGQNLPLIPVHHLRGHVASNYLTSTQLKPPFLALIVSGGHSHIVRVKDYTDYEVLGRTHDDAAGEAFDKVARILGVGYPGGREIERLAIDGNCNALQLPHSSFSDNPYDFSFSGLKTSVINYVHKCKQNGESVNPADVAASFCDTITSTLCDHFIQAALDHNEKKLVLAGGVSANTMLRKKVLQEAEKYGMDLCMPELKYCGDNAAMIASQAFYEYEKGIVAKPDLNAYATMDITTNYASSTEY